MTEFLYIQNEEWNGFEEWIPFHIKNEKDMLLFQYDTFSLLESNYTERFSKLICCKILTYD